MTKREIIKEIRLTRYRASYGKSVKDQAVGVVRDNCYGSKLSKFDELFEEALKTFPSLTKDQVRIAHYGGIQFKGTFGIEFNITEDIFESPDGWQAIRELESTL